MCHRSQRQDGEPSSRNPSRATHASCTPCAADSLIECHTHEYDRGIRVDAITTAAADPASMTSTAPADVHHRSGVTPGLSVATSTVGLTEGVVVMACSVFSDT